VTLKPENRQIEFNSNGQKLRKGAIQIVEISAERGRLSAGNVVSRRDFLPFGEELYADGVHWTVAGKYLLTGQDGVRQRFTGYQKDTETSLDFAEARMYANTYGRFTAVDPLLASGKSANPQTFNRYIYVLNNPLLLTDPDGLQVTSNPDEDSIKLETQLSRKAPWVGNVRVIHNGREVKNDLYVGDQFTIEWKFRINKLDDPKRIQRASTVSGVDRDRSTGFSNGKPIGTETEITKGNDSFSDAEGIKRLGDAKIVTVGARADETEVTMSQTFEIIGRKDGTPGASNQINFQITVVDPRAPLTPNRNSTKMEKGPLPANPAIFTTRTNDPRRDVTSDPSKAISYRNRKRSKEEEEEE